MSERVAPGLGEAFGGYTIESTLGRGGMGAVYLARHARLARHVALKVIAPELAHDEQFRARFLRETQLAASLEHPNVIPIYDAGEVDGVLYLAMRYVGGPSLRTFLRERGPLSAEQTFGIARQLGAALDAAHSAGLVHRDVKPANVLLSEADEHAFLCDFGLARRNDSEGLTQAGSFLGTADYAAPEQIGGGRSTAAPTSTPSAASSSTVSRGTPLTWATRNTRCCTRTSRAPRRSSRADARICRARSTRCC